MAKTQVATQPTAGAPPAELLDEMSKHAGAGLSKSQEDNLVPLIYILQKQSPQVEKRDPKYVEGAEAADIWLRNAPNPVVKGEDGLLFQPCYFSIDWVEWVPREQGGGFVARHKSLPADAKKQVDPQNPNKVTYKRPNGNEVVQTRNHIGYVLTENGAALPYVIPMFGSGHTVSREWMFKMNSKQLPSGDSAPSYAGLYKLRTRMRTNSRGQSWYTWQIDDAGWVRNKQELDRGLQLFEAFSSGEKQVETPQQDHANDPVAEDENAPM